MEDARELISSSLGHATYSYELELIIGTEVHRVTRVLAYNLSRDFVSNKFDSITIEFQIGLGTWLHRVLPNKDFIRAKVFATPTRFSNGLAKACGPEVVTEFKAVVEETANASVTTSNEVTNSKSEGDATQIVPKTLTLISDTVNSVRTAYVSSWFLGANMKTLMEGLFMQVGVVGIPSKSEYIAGKYKGVVGVSVYPPDNERAYDHTYLPEDTLLKNLPEKLQQLNGVYNHGIANYLHKGLWYVYPVTDTTRFNKASRRVVIYNVAKEKYFGIDTTFTFKGKELSILASGGAGMTDKSELRQYNEGNAIRLANSSAIMEDYLVINEAGELVANRKRNIMEGGLEARRDGVTMMRGGTEISGNTAKALSSLNKAAVAEYFLEWQNGDAMLLSPGMPCRLYYSKNNKAVAIDGIIAGIDSRDSLPNKNIGKAPFSNTSIIRVIGERVIIK